MSTERRELHELLERGDVKGALILKGNFSDEERELMRKAYEAGFAHGRASVLSATRGAE